MGHQHCQHSRLC
ncbi:hypothetical protein ZEAMMB73_Zm00001d049362 [Zea mays]|uniref:Uncharacterized protein n=1 Tax=Zea mays TaxID=4577 RepID=A0A1D6PU14_MAIZE|nr:hypothetical protein ZEAMMB73_Zm00001d049362 [Zea mays]AQK50114.1 hypothetical protein ZEAMMB73_Zm00001d049362 [Zea mays]